MNDEIETMMVAGLTDKVMRLTEENHALRAQVAAHRTTTVLVVAAWLVLLCIVAMTGCAAEAQDGELEATLVEVDVDLDGRPCLTAQGQPDPACCPVGFDAVGAHSGAVVCVRIGR